MGALRRLRIDWLGFGLAAAFLVAIQFLPPDTSLDEVRRAGALRACVPASAPPLVTGRPDRPGLDIELLREVASGLGVSLQVVTRPGLAKDFICATRESRGRNATSSPAASSPRRKPAPSST